MSSQQDNNHAQYSDDSDQDNKRQSVLSARRSKQVYYNDQNLNQFIQKIEIEQQSYQKMAGKSNSELLLQTESKQDNQLALNQQQRNGEQKQTQKQQILQNDLEQQQNQESQPDSKLKQAQPIQKIQVTQNVQFSEKQSYHNNQAASQQQEKDNNLANDCQSPVKINLNEDSSYQNLNSDSISLPVHLIQTELSDQHASNTLQIKQKQKEHLQQNFQIKNAYQSQKQQNQDQTGQGKNDKKQEEIQKSYQNDQTQDWKHQHPNKQIQNLQNQNQIYGKSLQAQFHQEANIPNYQFSHQRPEIIATSQISLQQLQSNDSRIQQQAQKYIQQISKYQQNQSMKQKNTIQNNQNSRNKQQNQLNIQHNQPHISPIQQNFHAQEEKNSQSEINDLNVQGHFIQEQKDKNQLNEKKYYSGFKPQQAVVQHISNIANNPLVEQGDLISQNSKIEYKKLPKTQQQQTNNFDLEIKQQKIKVNQHHKVQEKDQATLSNQIAQKSSQPSNSIFGNNFSRLDIGRNSEIMQVQPNQSQKQNAHLIQDEQMRQSHKNVRGNSSQNQNSGIRSQENMIKSNFPIAPDMQIENQMKKSVIGKQKQKNVIQQNKSCNCQIM